MYEALTCGELTEVERRAELSRSEEVGGECCTCDGKDFDDSLLM